MSTPGVTIAPLATAVARMHQKTPVAKQLTSAEWSDVPLALRERAFWTARFTLADTLQAMHDHIGKRLDLTRVTTDRGNVYANRDNFIVEMRKHLEMQGYVPPPGKAGTLQDHSTTGRLGMIFDINTQQAQEFARFKAETPDTLDAFPAQELFRAESRKEPRAWHARWTQAGGHLTQGRMIALKDSPVWQAISAFGTPWPPFDYQSGMDLRDISRPEAQRLGLIAPAQTISRPEIGFNDSLQKSVTRMDPSILADTVKHFGGLVRQQDGILEWVKGRHSLAIALDVPATLPNATMIKSAIADVASVHEYADIPDPLDPTKTLTVGIPLTPVGDKLHPVNEKAGAHAEYDPGHSNATGMPKINVSGTRGDGLSVLHEIGHEVDNRLFGQGMNYGTHSNPELDSLMKSIKDSPEIKAIEAKKFPGRSNLAKERRDHQEYLLKPHEQFARAYSQWIAERSGRTEHLVSLDQRIASGWGSQWKKETFAPIAAEFEKLFKAKGWLR